MLTSEEIHSFVIGFFELLCPWKARYHNSLPPPEYLKDEYHYYLAGRALGFITFLLILIGLAKLVKSLLL